MKKWILFLTLSSISYAGSEPNHEVQYRAGGGAGQPRPTDYPDINSSMPDVNRSLNHYFGGGNNNALDQAIERRNNAIQSAQEHTARFAQQTAQLAAANEAALRSPSLLSYVPSPSAPLEQVLANIPRPPVVNLEAIPNPSEGSLPYRFEAPPSDFRNEIVQQYKNLYKIQPTGFKRTAAKDFGLSATVQADHAYSLHNEEDARFFQEIGSAFLDIAVGLDPATGFARSAFELFTGRNMVTGVNLSNFERGLAFLGVATIGASRTGTVLATQMSHIFSGAAHILRERQAFDLALREGIVLYERAEGLITGSLRRFHIINIHEAEHLNASFPSHWDTVFQLGTHVIEAKTLQEYTKFIRLHNADGMVGRFVMRESAIRGLTVAEIRTRYAIPNTITHVSEVYVPRNTRLFRGNIQGHNGGVSGAVQYWLSDVEAEWFRNTRLFE